MNPAKFIKLSSRLLNGPKELRTVSEDCVMVFDIDLCLYQETQMIKQENENYLAEMREKYPFLTKAYLNELKQKYGTTKKGLFVEQHLYFDQIKRCDFFDVHRYLKPDTELRNVLESISCRKFCLTNAFIEKSENVLTALGILNCFEAVFCADDDPENPVFISKPDTSAYEFVRSYLNIKETTDVYFFDDQLQNIITANEFGWKSYHITEKEPIKQVLKANFSQQLLTNGSLSNMTNLKQNQPHTIRLPTYLEDEADKKHSTDILQTIGAI